MGIIGIIGIIGIGGWAFGRLAIVNNRIIMGFSDVLYYTVT